MLVNEPIAFLARRRLYFYSAAMLMGMAAWFVFFTAVAVGGAPFILMFLLFVSTGSAIMVAYAAPIDLRNPRAPRIQLFVLTMNMLGVFIAACGCLIATVSFSRKHSVVPGATVLVSSVMLMIAGALGHIGNSPDFFSMEELPDPMEEMEKQSEQMDEMEKRVSDRERENTRRQAQDAEEEEERAEMAAERRVERKEKREFQRELQKQLYAVEKRLSQEEAVIQINDMVECAQINKRVRDLKK